MADLTPIGRTPENATSHVIFFHGLDGHAIKTWQSGTKPPECWLEWVRTDFPKFGVWTFGYKASLSVWLGQAMALPDRGTSARARLLAQDELKTGNLVLIGHSLGGLVIKQLLRSAANSVLAGDVNATAFLNRVRHVAFLGTPHQGSDLANLASFFRFLIRPSKATLSLNRNDANLRELNIWYRAWSAREGVKHLVLTENEPLGLFGGIIVKPDSSDPGVNETPIPVDANHSSICKPVDRLSEVYVYVSNFLRASATTNIVVTTGIEHPALDANSTTLVPPIDDVAQVRAAEEQAEKIADILVERLGGAGVSLAPAVAALVDERIRQKLEEIKRARFYLHYPVKENAIELADRLASGDFASGSARARAVALAWCARWTSASALDRAQRILQLARDLSFCEEIEIAEAFCLSASGKIDEALSKLNALASQAARTAAFLVVISKRGVTDALNWLSDSGLAITDLGADGRLALALELIKANDWAALSSLRNKLVAADFEAAPALYHAAAVSDLLVAVPEEFRAVVAFQIPFDSGSFPLAATDVALAARGSARKLFEASSKAAESLGCELPAHADADYALWLGLHDPEHRTSALQELAASMRDPSQALRRIPLALQNGLKLDLAEVESEVERQTALFQRATEAERQAASFRGTSIFAASARLALALTKQTPREAAEYIARHKSQLQTHLNISVIDHMEITLLAKAGLKDRAQACLDRLIEAGLPAAEVGHLQRLIADAQDPIGSLRSEYERSGGISELMNLVQTLFEQRDWSQLLQYASILFDRTKAVSDAEYVVGAFDKLGKHAALSEFLETNQYLVNQSERLKTYWSWALFRRGQFKQATVFLAELKRARDTPSDRNLAVSLAISTGDWERLQSLVENEWESRNERTAEELIRAAGLAQSAGSPRTKELTTTAVEKAPTDPKVLTGAYGLATNGGWEVDAAVAEWLKAAIELSGEDGPIQKVSLQELVDRQPDWNRRESETLELLTKGEIPIFIAASTLNRSLIDFFLFPALRNRKEVDPRRRVLIPAYSGVRRFFLDVPSSLGVEATSLLTFAALQMLDAVAAGVQSIVIPHSTLNWLFKEKQKVAFHQSC